jgi:hypothetical protein
MNTTTDPAPHPRDSGAFANVAWTPRDVLFGVLWFIGIFAAGQVVILPLVAFGDTSGELYTGAFIAGAAVEVSIAIVAMNFTMRRYGGGWAVLGVRKPDRAAFLWALFAFAGALIVSLIYSALVEVFDLGWLRSNCAEQIPKGVRDTRALLALASFTVIAFAPVCEELFFRGFVFPGISKRWGLVAGIVVSGLVFSSAHLLYKSFVPIAGVGMIFAFSYYRSRNIFTTMMAHVAFNTVSIIAIAAGSCDSTSSIGLLRGWLL